MSLPPPPQYAGFYEVPSHSAVAQRVVGFVGFAVFLVASVVVGAVALRSRDSLMSGSARSRVFLYALSLAVFYPMVGLNRIVWRRPGNDDGDAFNVAQLVLNLLTWVMALGELVHVQAATPAANYRARSVVSAVLYTLALASFWSDEARFMALLTLVPLVCVLAALAYAWAAPWRNVAETPSWRPGSPRFAFAALLPLGLLALTMELLSPTYGGVLTIAGSFGAMLATHVLLVAYVAQLLYGSSGDGDAAPTLPLAQQPLDTGGGGVGTPVDVQHTQSLLDGTTVHPGNGSASLNF